MSEPDNRPEDISVAWRRVDPATEQAAPPPPKAGLIPPAQRTIAWLILVLIVVLALVAASPYWAPSLASALPWGRAQEDKSADVVATLQSRLEEADAEIRTLSGRVAKLESASGEVKNLAARIGTLEARPPEIVTMPPPPAPAPVSPPPAAEPTTPAPVAAPAPPATSPETEAALQTLREQVAKLSDDLAAANARAAKLDLQVANAGDQGRGERALLLALANLRIAMSGSTPYASELATVQAVAGDRTDVKEALAALSDGAAAGMPSTARLAARFDRDVAPAILRAATKSESTDWGDQILARLRRLVVIRRVGPGATGDDPTEDAVARAEASLRAGDLTGAIAALGKLSGASAEAAAPWLASAKQRLAAETALTKLWQAEAARVAAASAPAPGAKP